MIMDLKMIVNMVICLIIQTQLVLAPISGQMFPAKFAPKMNLCVLATINICNHPLSHKEISSGEG